MVRIMGIIPSLFALMEKKVSTNPVVVSFYARRYHQVIRKEIELAQITDSDQILNIGCGGIPYTAIHMAKFTGARVIAIDRDQEAVEAAQNCVSSLKMQDQVTVAKADGTEKIPFSFNVAIAALQCEPKDKILENLMSAGDDGARLIFRRPREGVESQYNKLPDTITPHSMVVQNKATFDGSVLYRIENNKTRREKDFSTLVTAV